jgi:hypothetical protein
MLDVGSSPLQHTRPTLLSRAGVSLPGFCEV